MCWNVWKKTLCDWLLECNSKPVSVLALEPLGRVRHLRLGAGATLSNKQILPKVIMLLSAWFPYLEVAREDSLRTRIGHQSWYLVVLFRSSGRYLHHPKMHTKDRCLKRKVCIFWRTEQKLLPFLIIKEGKKSFNFHIHLAAKWQKFQFQRMFLK